MDFMNFVAENVIILVPFLYAIGVILKGTEKVQDKLIPVLLLPVGIGMTVWTMGFNPDAVINGVLVVAASVYCNQLIKQLT